MGNTFFENRRKQHLEKKLAKLQKDLRHTYSYRMSLEKDVQQSERELLKPLSEKDSDYWKHRKDSCQRRVDVSMDKAERLLDKIAAINKKLEELEESS